MPIYAYRCTDCGFEKEVMRKVSDPLLTTCPECKTENFAKQLTAPGFHLKGSGWYATDFKGGGCKSADSKSDNPPPCQGGTGRCAANS
jgi:putative FmdB family regulatory protein